MNSKKLLTIAKWVWIIAVIFGGGYYLFQNWARMVQYFQLIPFYKLALSAIFLLFGKLFLVFFSKFSLEKENSFISYLQAFRIVSISQLGKYVPGGIWHFVGRYNAYHNHQVSVKKSTRALISENIWLLSGAVVIGSLFGLYSKSGQTVLMRLKIAPTFLSSTIIAVIVLILWLGGLFFYEWVFLNKRNRITITPFIKLITVQLMTWILLGISFSFVLPDLSMEILPDTIFGYSISWVIGYVAIFAPGGIGIREGALVWFFSGLFLPEDIVVYSTVHRFLFVFVEIILGLTAVLLKPKTELTETQTITPLES